MNPQPTTISPSASYLINLSDHTKFLLTGEDRIRYLNGQVTNDVRKANPTSTLHACVTNIKGRIEGPLHILTPQHQPAELWLTSEPELRETLATRLERYIIADDVELHDITDQWQLFHLCGPATSSFLSQTSTNHTYQSNRYGIPGVDLWLPAEQPPPTPPLFTPLTPAQSNQLRILHGIPRWPEELNDQVFPQEAGLESTAMDFHKGCYIGQEILSRIKTSGKTRLQLIRIQFPKSSLGNTPPESLSNANLLDANEDFSARPVGHLTSLTSHPELDQFIGLAYVRHNLPSPHSLLLVTEPESKIAIPIQAEPLIPQ